MLNSTQSARYLGIQSQTLRKWRCSGRGPKYVRFGGMKGRVYYQLEELEKFVNSRTYRSTSEESVKNCNEVSEK